VGLQLKSRLNIRLTADYFWLQYLAEEETV